MVCIDSFPLRGKEVWGHLLQMGPGVAHIFEEAEGKKLGFRRDGLFWLNVTVEPVMDRLDSSPLRKREVRGHLLLQMGPGVAHIFELALGAQALVKSALGTSEFRIPMSKFSWCACSAQFICQAICAMH